MNLKNTIKIALITLLILNGTLIFLLVFKSDGPKRAMRPHLGGMDAKENPIANLVSERLGLDEVQKKKYLEMAEMHRKEMKSIDREERGAIKSYLSYLKSEPNQVLSKSELQNLIEQLEGEKITSTYKHFEDLKSMCNDQQLKKIDTVIEEMMSVILKREEGNRRPPRN